MNPQRTTGRLNGDRTRQLLKGVEARRPAERDLPLHERLRALAEEVSPADIDELWVFPPLPNREAAAEFLLLTGYHVESDRHRRVITAHVEAEFEDEEGLDFVWVQRVERVGPVPQDWLESLPDSLLGRFAEAGTPEVHEIGGQPEAWEALLARFAEAGGGVRNGNGGSNGNGLDVEGGAAPAIAMNGNGRWHGGAETNGRSSEAASAEAVDAATLSESKPG